MPETSSSIWSTQRRVSSAMSIISQNTFLIRSFVRSFIHSPIFIGDSNNLPTAKTANKVEVRNMVELGIDETAKYLCNSRGLSLDLEEEPVM